MYIEDRLEAIEKTVEEIKNILLHRVVPIDTPEVKPDAPKEETKPKTENKTKEVLREKHPTDDAKDSKAVRQEVDKTDGQADKKNIKTVIGLIDNQVKGEGGEVICYLRSKEPVTIPGTDKKAIKYSFLILDKRYGTWDESVANKLLECVDNRRMVKIEYKERPSGDKVFNDIINFKEATVDEVNANGG